MKFEFYKSKRTELWLQHEYDDIHNETLEYSPKVAFIFALDWKLYDERPSRYLKRDLYKTFTTTIYLGYYNFTVYLKYKKLPYTTLEEYRRYNEN